MAKSFPSLHKMLGTDTLLPTPSNAKKDSFLLGQNYMGRAGTEGT